jgi:hypothetical protein
MHATSENQGHRRIRRCHRHAKDGDALSVVGKSAALRALTPRQAYEYNLHARKAINSIAENTAKAARRLFSRHTGEEIVSGDAFNLCRDNPMADNVKRMIRDGPEVSIPPRTRAPA